MTRLFWRRLWWFFLNGYEPLPPHLRYPDDRRQP